MIANQDRNKVCTSCLLQISNSDSSKQFLSPGGHPLCFGCFINYSINKTENEEEDLPSPLLCSSILVCSPAGKETLQLHKMNFNLESCNKHIWTELKSQKLKAYTYCTVCDLSMCSVCLLSTAHRYHKTCQLSDLFDSIDDVPIAQYAKKKPSNDHSALGKVAQRVISLLSTPPTGLSGLLGSAAQQKTSPLNNTSEGKSLFLLDVLNKDLNKSSRSREPQIRGFSIEEKAPINQRSVLKNQIIRRKSPLTVNTTVLQKEHMLLKSQRQMNLMSPLVKFTDKKPTIQPRSEYYQDIQEANAQNNLIFSIYKPKAPSKCTGHIKAQSLVPKDMSNLEIDNKENQSPEQDGASIEAKKVIKRVVSSSKTRVDTPRQASDLSDFLTGIEKALGKIAHSTCAKHFSLSRMGISKSNLSQLVGLLRNYKISQIDLSYNSLTDCCLPQLAEVFKTQAIRIDFRGNLLTSKAVEQLKHSCPSCTILF